MHHCIAFYDVFIAASLPLFVCVSVYRSLYLFVYLFVYLSVYYVCLCVYLSFICLRVLVPSLDGLIPIHSAVLGSVEKDTEPYGKCAGSTDYFTI